MIIGTQQQFGIEVSIRCVDSRNPIGDLWLWASGEKLGDCVSGVVLPFVLEVLSNPLRLRNERHCHLFDRMTANQVVDFFRGVVIDGTSVPEYIKHTIELFSRYLVISAQDLEGFDSVFLILIGCPDGRDRLIWQVKGVVNASERVLERDEYDESVLELFDRIEANTGYRSPRRELLSP